MALLKPLVNEQAASAAFSGTRFGPIYLMLQAVAFAGWWAVLLSVPESARYFLPPELDRTALLVFMLPDLAVVALASAASSVLAFLRSRWAVPIAWFAAGAVVYAAIYTLSWAALYDGGWLGVLAMLPPALLSTVGAIDMSSGIVPVFSRARPASRLMYIVATLTQILVFWGIILFAVPAALHYAEARVEWIPLLVMPLQKPIAVVMFLAFSVLGLTSSMTMVAQGSGTPLPFSGPNHLVIRGPYAWLRNPMVFSGIGQGAAVALWYGSPTVLIYVILGGMIWQLVVRPAEERDLAAAFGAQYDEYRRNVRLWIPGKGGGRREKYEG